jgi:hypothetical protein
MEKGLNMWKQIILFVPLFFVGILLDCMLEPGGAVSFRDYERSSVVPSGKTDVKNTTKDKTDGKVTNSKPPKELTNAEHMALFESLSREERQKVRVEEFKVLLEARNEPRAKEGSLLQLYEGHRQNFDLFFKYNRIPDDIKKKVLTILANSDFDFTENYYTAAIMTGNTASEESRVLSHESKEKRRAEMLKIMDENMVEKITYLSDRRAIFKELFQAWRTGDQFATYMSESSVPLDPRQVCALVDVLSEGNANPADDSVHEAISALLTHEQMKQFENYRREETLLAETQAADRETERKWKRD